MVVVPYCTLTLSDMGLSLKFHKGTTNKQQRKPVGLLELERGGGKGRIGTSYKGPDGGGPPPPPPPPPPEGCLFQDPGIYI